MSALLIFLAGLGLLIVAAEVVVRIASRLALNLGVTPFVLGLTVVAIGTSMPELAVGITATREGAGGIAVGNIAGTNMVNILFILGLSALLRPLALNPQAIKLDLPMIVLASAMMAVLAWDGSLSRFDGALMCVTAALYTLLLIRLNRAQPFAYAAEAADTTNKLAVYAFDVILLLVGLAMSVLGAHWLVDGAVTIARSYGVPDAVIGLTIVAIGTSGPELVTTIVSTIRNQREVAVGNLLGSSTYNILVILGITCLLSPVGIPVERALLSFDIPLMLALAVLCVPIFVSGKQVSRAEGALFVTLYLGYLTWLVIFRA